MTKHRLLVKYVVDNVNIGTKVKKLYLQGINICDQLPWPEIFNFLKIDVCLDRLTSKRPNFWEAITIYYNRSIYVIKHGREDCNQIQSSSGSNIEENCMVA